MIRESNKVKDADIFLSKYVLVTRILVNHYSLNHRTQFLEMIVDSNSTPVLTLIMIGRDWKYLADLRQTLWKMSILVHLGLTEGGEAFRGSSPQGEI